MSNIVELNRDYIQGIHAAKMDVAKGHVYDIDGALYMYAIDPANTEYQRGYHAGLIQCKRKQEDFEQWCRDSGDPHFGDPESVGG